MIERIRRAREDRGGFTLIELLVVVIIIGILAAIAIPAFLGQQDRAEDSGAESALRNAATAVEAAYVDDRDYLAFGVTELKAIEPTLDWDAADAASAMAENNQVFYSGTADDAYTLTSTSNSDRVYTYSKDEGVVTRNYTGGDCPAATANPPVSGVCSW